MLKTTSDLSHLHLVIRETKKVICHIPKDNAQKSVVRIFTLQHKLDRARHGVNGQVKNLAASIQETHHLFLLERVVLCDVRKTDLCH